MEKEVNRVSIQMRQTETLLLNKLKSDRENFDSHITQLINYTYRELMIGLDKLGDLNSKLKSEKCFGFRALLNLLSEILSIGDVSLPFDGRILDSTNQVLDFFYLVKGFCLMLFFIALKIKILFFRNLANVFVN